MLKFEFFFFFNVQAIGSLNTIMNSNNLVHASAHYYNVNLGGGSNKSTM